MLIDAIFIVLMALAVMKGYRNGLVVAAFSLVGIVIGLAAAMKLSAVVAGKLGETGNAWLPFLSFALVMLVVILLVRLGARLVKAGLQLAMLGWADSLFGILLYACLYTTVFSVVLFFAVNIHLVGPETTANSKCYFFIRPWGPKAIDAFGAVIPAFKGLFGQLTQFFERVADHVK